MDSDDKSRDDTPLTGPLVTGPKQASEVVAGILSFLLIAIILGRSLTASIIIVIILARIQQQWQIYASNIAQSVSARRAVLAKEARRRRTHEVSIISAAVGRSLLQVHEEERAELNALRGAAEQFRQKATKEIISQVIGHLIMFQKNEKIKQEKMQLEALRELEQKETRTEPTVMMLEDRKSVPEVKKLKELLETKETDRTLKKRESRSEGEIKQKGLPEAGKQLSLFMPLTAPRSIIIDLPQPLCMYEPDIPGFTCIGQTKLNKRCSMTMISNEARGAAAERLALMQSANPDVTLFKLVALKQLADWMLCPRWHRDKRPQGAEIAQWWYKLLAPARRRLAAHAAASFSSSLYSPSTAPLLLFSPSSSSVPSIFS
jgi:hypothetical protein